MDYGTIISNAVEATGRPDKTGYITGRINSVVRSLVSLQDSYNDLVQVADLVIPDVDVGNNGTIVNVTLPALFRKVAYLRPLPFTKLLDPVTPDKAIMNTSTGGKELTNCYYIAGGVIIMRLRDGFQSQNFAFGYYAYPAVLTASTDTNWLTDTYGELIVDILCASVFRLTGDIKTAQALEGGPVGITARLEQLRTNNKSGGTANTIGTMSI